MALSLQLGFPDVPKSITNPNVKRGDALDVDGPVSFLSFIKIINASFEPDTLQNYYNYYLKSWNSKNTSKNIDNQTLIIDRYKEFLKDVAISHTTFEEKQFLTSVDFDDPFDLDVILGFYSKKLTELSTFYNSKRNDVKFNPTRTKLRGTNFGTEKTIFELTLSYLKGLDDGKILFDYDSIKNKLEIEIEELYDVYPLYFNQLPNDRIYDNKDLDYGYDIFLKSNSELVSKVFSGLSLELQTLKEVDSLLNNKRELTKKYISTDFYFLSTGSTVTDFISGKLFDSVNPISNFRNRHYPTTASTPKLDYLLSERDIGFFRPHKTSVVLVGGDNSSFYINFENLSPNSLYYFPDPVIFGDSGEVLTFIVDDSNLKRTFSSGNAVNQPYNSPTDTKYNGYVSNTELSQSKYLDGIFDSGFIQDIKTDFYGNTFGLFKNDHRFKKSITNIDKIDLYNVVFNGYKFYDNLYNEGLDFSYTTSDDSTFRETTRSGLSTNTGNFTTITPDLVLPFGLFTPYNELITPTESNLVTTYRILEGGFITKDDLSLYPDSTSSDLYSFEFDTGSFYYSTLIEGGVTDSPDQRALLDPLYPTLSAEFTQYPQTPSLSIVDGGMFGDNADFDITINPKQYAYIDDVENITTYTLSTTPYSDDYTLNGKIFIKNVSTKSILPLSGALPYITSKYPSNIIEEINSNVLKFELTNDVLIIESPSYLTINKLLFNDGIFQDPKASSIAISISGGYEKFSNRYRIGQMVYYCKLNTTSSTISSNNFIIYPEIYQLDLINFKNSKLFPLNDNDVTEFFNISGDNIRYLTTDSPTFTHTSRNNTFNISFLLKDPNNIPSLHQMDFYLNPDVIFTSHVKSNLHPYSNTNILSSIGSLNLFLSGGDITHIGEELIL